VSVPDRDRWQSIWQAAALSGNPFPWFDRLATLYTEPHRHYHNLVHLAECLREFDPVRQLAREPAAVELALWFHDAIYDPRAADNEERSAALAEECLKAAAARGELTQAVVRLVLATKRHEIELDADAPLMVDVDLSILGQPTARFDEYEWQIRAEYSWVPETMFAGKRAEILEGFLARRRLYATEWFHDRYESRARINLRNSIAALRSRPSG
jgi:predicted metal-dependent HD superfamily phosphohydrolase